MTDIADIGADGHAPVVLLRVSGQITLELIHLGIFLLIVGEFEITVGVGHKSGDQDGHGPDEGQQEAEGAGGEDVGVLPRSDEDQQTVEGNGQDQPLHQLVGQPAENIRTTVKP